MPAALTQIVTALGVVVALRGVAQLLFSGRSGGSIGGGLTGIAMGVILAASGSFLPRVINSFSKTMTNVGGDSGDVDSNTPATTEAPSSDPTTSTPSPSSTPSPHSSTASEHASSMPTGLALFIVIVVVGLIVAAVAGYLAWMFVADRRVLRKEKLEESRRQQEIRREVEHQWSIMIKRAKAITATWDSYESDPHKFLSQPAIRDMGVPEVQAAVRALMNVRENYSPFPEQGVTNIPATKYGAAVIEAENAVNDAIRVTRAMVETSMTAAERDLLTEAQRLLALALNDGATPEERKLSYRRLRKVLTRLDIILPTKTLEQIETSHPLLLEAA